MQTPRITVVLPVRNGGRYVRGAIESVLAQQHDAFELLVLDNASDDGSLDFLTGAVSQRVRVERASSPLSIEESWARIHRTKRAPWMTMLCHDDELHPAFLRTVEALAGAHADGALFHAHFRIVDAAGRVVRPCRAMPAREDAAGFLAARLAGERDSCGSGVLFRSGAFDRAGGMPQLHRLLYADDVLWLTLMRDGPRYTARDELFSWRAHPQSAGASSSADDAIRGRAQFVEFLRSEIARQPSLRAHLPRAEALLIAERGRVRIAQANAGLRDDAPSHADLLAEADAAGVDVRRHVEVLLAEPAARAHEIVRRFPPAQVAYRAFRRVRHRGRGSWIEGTSPPRPCPGCGADAAMLLRAVDENHHISQERFSYHRCDKCGRVFLWPVPPNLSTFYPRAYYTIPTSDQLELGGRNEQHKIDLLKPFAAGGALLEIGPACGYFAHAARRAGFAVTTIEMDPACCRFLRDVVGVDVVESDDPAAALRTQPMFDVIALWHVIEHIPDPARVLAACAAHLKPGGILAVAAPNPEAFQFRVLGARWVHLDAPRHVVFIPLATLEADMRKLGLCTALATTSDDGGKGWDRFGWERSLANLAGDLHVGARVLAKVGRLAARGLERFDGEPLQGSAYTALFQKPSPVDT